MRTVRSVCDDPAGARNVISISLSTQGGTFVPVDAHGHALRPAIAWSDSCTQQEQDAFLREVGPAETMYQKTGWPLGLETGCVLIAGTHGQYAAALGAGMTHVGNILIAPTPAGALPCSAAAPIFPPALRSPFWRCPDCGGTPLSLPAGGVCLDWLRRNIARGESGDPLSYEALSREIALRRAGTDGSLFVPF